MPDDPIQAAARVLADARHVCVSTGAGMSKECGIDTFRGDDGTWSKFNPEELASPQGFARDPVKVWAWYRARRKQLAEIEPHEGHRVLARWEQRVPTLTLVTQNIDGLHRRAGSETVHELHGRLDSVKCTYCDYNTQTLDDLGPEPACPLCQKRMRPDVVWFGEALPMGELDAAYTAAQDCDVCVLIGTSGVVYPAAGIGEAAKACGAKVIEINPNPTELSFLADVCVRTGCRDALTAIDAAWSA